MLEQTSNLLFVKLISRKIFNQFHEFFFVIKFREIATFGVRVIYSTHHRRMNEATNSSLHRSCGRCRRQRFGRSEVVVSVQQSPCVQCNPSRPSCNIEQVVSSARVSNFVIIQFHYFLKKKIREIDVMVKIFCEFNFTKFLSTNVFSAIPAGHKLYH